MINGKCDTLSLEYLGQKIDISDIDTLRMSIRANWMVSNKG